MVRFGRSAGPARSPNLYPLRALPHRLPDLPRAQDRAGFAPRQDLPHARAGRGPDPAERRAGSPPRPLPRLPGVRDGLPGGCSLRPHARGDARTARAPRSHQDDAPDDRHVGARAPGAPSRAHAPRGGSAAARPERTDRGVHALASRAPNPAGVRAPGVCDDSADREPRGSQPREAPSRPAEGCAVRGAQGRLGVPPGGANPARASRSSPPA